jgi:hypothetical protein
MLVAMPTFAEGMFFREKHRMATPVGHGTRNVVGQALPDIGVFLIVRQSLTYY